MPIYEYRCDDCGHEFEAIQKISDALLTTCPSCEHDTLRKKVSAAAFRLKGGGWYETDFKSDKRRNVAGEQKPSGEGGDSGGKQDSAGEGGKAEKASAKGGDKDAASKSGDGGGRSSGEGKGGNGTSKPAKGD